MQASRLGLFSLTIVLTLAPPGGAQSESGLIGHWKLDERGPSELAADASPHQWHGTRGACSGEGSVPGKFGPALRFPAAGTIRLDRHAPALGKLTDFTVSMWIQYEGGASRQLLTFSDGTTSHRVQVEVHNDCLHFGWQNGGSFAGFGTEQLAWTPGTWYHVVFVSDARAGKSILRSNDLVWKIDANTLSPADLKSPVQRVEIGSLNGEYAFLGCVDEVRLFDSALPLPEQLALYDAPQGPPADPQWQAAKTALVERETARQNHGLFLKAVEQDGRWSGSERQRRLDWLFQAEEDGLVARTSKELVWTRELIQRLQGRADLSGELAAWRKLEQSFSVVAATPDAATMLTRYFDIRALKRRVMLKSPEIDFSKIVCVDAPYTRRSPDTHGTAHQNEWVHESRFRSEMCASHGAQLLVLEDAADAPVPRPLAPPADFGRPVAMLGFDLSFDAGRALFCMKPEDEKAYHLYEIGLDGNGFRQITSGGYSDIDPIYLPGDRYLFLSTRAEVYAQCGMWARSHILTRCDADGSNLYILSPATEPEYSPSLLDDGRILFTRWEYVDKHALGVRGQVRQSDPIALDDAPRRHGGGDVLGQSVRLSRSPWRSATDSRQRENHVQWIRPSRRLGRMPRHRRSETGPELPARHLESHPRASLARGGRRSGSDAGRDGALSHVGPIRRVQDAVSAQ